MEKVIFRKWSNGDVIALFPDYEHGSRDLVMSYQNIGQHSEASYSGVVEQTKLASEEEYRDLLEELKGIGYELVVVKRR